MEDINKPTAKCLSAIAGCSPKMVYAIRQGVRSDTFNISEIEKEYCQEMRKVSTRLSKKYGRSKDKEAGDG